MYFGFLRILFSKMVLVVIMHVAESGEKQADFRVDLIKLGNILDAMDKVKFKEQTVESERKRGACVSSLAVVWCCPQDAQVSGPLSSLFNKRRAW